MKPIRSGNRGSEATELENVIRLLRDHESEFRARGVARLAVFGSVARGEAGNRSDLDVVIEIEPGRKFSLIDQGSLRVRLCEIVGRQVDVVVRKSLRPRFAQAVAKESVAVF